MPRGASARRHAQAVFQLAMERQELEKWRADLRQIAELLQDPQVAAFLEAPKLHLQEKVKLVDAGLGDVNPLAKNLAYLLVSKGRLRLAGDILREYERMVDAHYGIEHAEVSSVVPLEEADKEKLQSRLGEVTGKKVMLKTAIDPSLMGGLVVKIGDHLIDGSLRTRLEELKKNLKAG